MTEECLLDEAIPDRHIYAGKIPWNWNIGMSTMPSLPSSAWPRRRSFTIFTDEEDEYEESEGPPRPFVDEEDAHLVCSYVGTEHLLGKPIRLHAPAIDIDYPVHVRESSPGKSHLFIDRVLTEENYFKLLDVMAEVGLVEKGYVKASKSRKTTYLRMPDVVKGSKTTLDEVVADRKRRMSRPKQALKKAIERLK